MIKNFKAFRITKNKKDTGVFSKTKPEEQNMIHEQNNLGNDGSNNEIEIEENNSN